MQRSINTKHLIKNLIEEGSSWRKHARGERLLVHGSFRTFEFEYIERAVCGLSLFSLQLHQLAECIHDPLEGNGTIMPKNSLL
ncbi:hypothetical protein CYMTET_6274 [Cymbomonas tetramitiformis]|uniref:Uncharacterized protein n=1 Tax=Cymbomonas tetramitiformis TaxID=36881 RepID=A0AAE0LI83_9CHLO|nr:hypothetical protein CYMTET_6274 [Cymbomonas tetramitiformis]